MGLKHQTSTSTMKRFKTKNQDLKQRNEVVDMKRAIVLHRLAENAKKK